MQSVAQPASTERVVVRSDQALAKTVMGPPLQPVCDGMSVAEVGYDCQGELEEGFLTSNHVWVATQATTSALKLDGVWREVHFAPGGTSILPAGMPYALRWRGPGRGIMINIAPRLLVETLGDASGKAIELSPVQGSRDPLIAELAYALTANSLEARDGLYQETLARALALRLCRNICPAASSPGGRPRWRCFR